MKVYNLCCEYDHRFEGWFSSEDDFIAQAQKQLVCCPVCDSHQVKRLPSAPRLNLATQPESAQPIQQDNAIETLQAQWIEMAREVIANTEDVGERFAEEARRMHYKDSPERGIRGITTPHERQALADEGIEVVAFPIPVALKRTLQ
jgi:hypothetical protein